MKVYDSIFSLSHTHGLTFLRMSKDEPQIRPRNQCKHRAISLQNLGTITDELLGEIRKIDKYTTKLGRTREYNNIDFIAQSRKTQKKNERKKNKIP